LHVNLDGLIYSILGENCMINGAKCKVPSAGYRVLIWFVRGILNPEPETYFFPKVQNQFLLQNFYI